MESDSSQQSACRRTAMVLACVCTAIALWGAAMAYYPGGNWQDPLAHGHDFLRNFLCDLGNRVALNGEPNPIGSTVARTAMIVLAVGLAIFWWEVAALVGRRRWVRLTIRSSGLCSALGMSAIALPDIPWAHPASVFLAAIPGAIAIGISLAGLASGTKAERWLAAWGGVTVVIGVADGVLYARRVVTGSNDTLALSGLQRVAALLYLGWIIAVALRRCSAARRATVTA